MLPSLHGYHWERTRSSLFIMFVNMHIFNVTGGDDKKMSSQKNLCGGGGGGGGARGGGGSSVFSENTVRFICLALETSVTFACFNLNTA